MKTITIPRSDWSQGTTTEAKHILAERVDKRHVLDFGILDCESCGTKTLYIIEFIPNNLMSYEPTDPIETLSVHVEILHCPVCDSVVNVAIDCVSYDAPRVRYLEYWNDDISTNIENKFTVEFGDLEMHRIPNRDQRVVHVELRINEEMFLEARRQGHNKFITIISDKLADACYKQLTGDLYER